MIPMTTILHKQELNFVHMTLMELLPYNCVELGQLFSAVQHYNEAKRKDAHHVNAEWDEKHEEVSVVSPSDAVVNPRTMMVKGLVIIIYVLDFNTINIDNSSSIPRYSYCRHCSANISVVGRTGRWHTTSFAQWCRVFQHFCREEPWNHPPYLRLRLLEQIKFGFKCEIMGHYLQHCRLISNGQIMFEYF